MCRVCSIFYEDPLERVAKPTGVIKREVGRDCSDIECGARADLVDVEASIGAVENVRVVQI